MSTSPTVMGHLKDAGNLAKDQVQNNWKRLSDHVQEHGLFKSAGHGLEKFGEHVGKNKLGYALGATTVATIAVMRHRHRSRLADQEQQQFRGYER